MNLSGTLRFTSPEQKNLSNGELEKLAKTMIDNLIYLNLNGMAIGMVTEAYVDGRIIKYNIRLDRHSNIVVEKPELDQSVYVPVTTDTYYNKSEMSGLTRIIDIIENEDGFWVLTEKQPKKWYMWSTLKDYQSEYEGLEL